MRKFFRQLNWSKPYESGWLFVTSGVTLLSGVLQTIFDPFPSLAFYIALSLVVLQLLYIVHDTQNRVRMMDVSNNNIVPHTPLDAKQEEFEVLLGSGEVSNAKIICYGTSGYGKMIEKIISAIVEYDTLASASDSRAQKRRDKLQPLANLKVEALLCCPNSPYCLSDRDRRKIRELAELASNASDKIEIIYSCTPPTIRASIAYRNKTSVWAWLQIYSYSKHRVSGMDSASSGEFPSFFASEDIHEMLDNLSSQIEHEFNTLSRCKPNIRNTCIKQKCETCKCVPEAAKT